MDSRAMNGDRYWSSRLHRQGQTVAYLAAMLAILLGAGFIVFGPWGAVWAGVGSLLLLGLASEIPVATVMRVRRARRLSAWEAPDLNGLLAELGRRAGLPHPPAVYLVPEPQPQAFAVGNREEAAVGVTRGLLAMLHRSELAGVLAHEVSHVAAGDLRILSLARTVRRLTGSIVMFGWIAWAMSAVGVLPAVSPWLMILLAVIPSASLLAEAAVSRTREFDADLSAAGLVGDPRPLAAALIRLRAYQEGLSRWLPVAALSDLVPEPLRSHPATEERVRRLLGLVAAPPRPPRLGPFQPRVAHFG